MGGGGELYICQLVMGVLHGILTLFAMTQIAGRAFTLHSLAYLMLLFQARCARCVTWRIAFKAAFWGGGVGGAVFLRVKGSI